MKLALITFRAAIAFAIGLMLYLYVALVDVLAPIGGIELLVGLVFQLVLGLILTAIAMVPITLVGVPFWVGPGKRLIAVLHVLGAAAFVLAFLGLGYTFTHYESVPHPDMQFAAAGEMYDAYDGTYAIQSWLAAMFGIAHFPLPPSLFSRRRIDEPLSTIDAIGR
jgi:hypothetical protein